MYFYITSISTLLCFPFLQFFSSVAHVIYSLRLCNNQPLAIKFCSTLSRAFGCEPRSGLSEYLTTDQPDTTPYATIQKGERVEWISESLRGWFS